MSLAHLWQVRQWRYILPVTWHCDDGHINCKSETRKRQKWTGREDHRYPLQYFWFSWWHCAWKQCGEKTERRSLSMWVATGRWLGTATRLSTKPNRICGSTLFWASLTPSDWVSSDLSGERNTASWWVCSECALCVLSASCIAHLCVFLSNISITNNRLTGGEHMAAVLLLLFLEEAYDMNLAHSFIPSLVPHVVGVLTWTVYMIILSQLTNSFPTKSTHHYKKPNSDHQRTNMCDTSLSYVIINCLK